MTAHAESAAPIARSVSLSGVADAVTYWTAAAGIYIAYGFLWFYSAKEKLFDQDGTMPAGLAKTYAGHFISDFPGVNTSWLLLGLLEGVAFLAILGSLLAGEFLPSRRRKPILVAGLAISLFTFAVMTFGQNVVGNFDGVASLFAYMGVTAVLLVLVRLRERS